MKKRALTIVFFLIGVLLRYQVVMGYDDAQTHPAITNFAVDKSILKTYLPKNLGSEFLKGYESIVNGKSVVEWIRKGSIDEDTPSCRASNHFHNPLLSWDQSYMSDDVTPMAQLIREFCNITGWPCFMRKSDVTWATGYLAPAPEGKKATFLTLYKVYNWDKARDYYYKALTSTSKPSRESNFAQTFENLGHILHLLQDVSVPAHVRNDFQSHLTINEIGLQDPRKWVIQPLEHFIKVNRGIVTTFNPDGSFPEFSSQSLTKFWDTDQYTGSNPSSSKSIGLAEYANANFLSDTTIFKGFLDPLHSFPYPAWTSVEEYDEIDTYTGQPTTYLKKVRNGETISHLAAAKWYYKYLPSILKNTGLELDDKCHNDYAEKLIPRAVGYSAGLLNYFFRGDVRLEYVTSPNPGYVFVNNTGEKMEGDFTVYYDNVNNERFPVWAGKGTLEATIGDKTNTFDIILPSDAKEPGKYIVVFKGKMGNEDGAVAGYVLQRFLKITPPDQFLYSIADEDQPDPYFTSIKAKVRNASTSEAMQNGVIQAIAKYKTGINDVDYIYSMSAPQSISSLAPDQTTEFEFNFSNDPIPVDVTDLYLQVIFKGTIGNENNALAIGLKDISEPTPIDVFNNMDRICINGQWYVTGTQEAYNALPAGAKWWDYWTHDLKDEYIKVSPATDNSDASPTNYTFYKPLIEAGTLYRRFILCDYEFMHSGYGTMIPKDTTNDTFIHDNAIKKVTAQGSGVRNQEEYTTDQAVCSKYGLNAPCTVRRTSSFYLFRGVEMWGPGGIIVDGLSYPNYTDPNYIPCAWDAL